MSKPHQTSPNQAQKTFSPDVPLPIVNFSRIVYVLTLGAAFALQQPLITTALLALVLISIVGGRKWNLINRLGAIILKQHIKSQTAVPLEDARLLRFNSFILIGLLGAAQIAFWIAGAPVVGWVLTGLVFLASLAAAAGFCLGCVLYYQFKLHKYKFLGEA